MAVDVRIYPEHVQSLRRALQALEGERAICEKWAYPTVELRLAIDDIAELIDKAEAAGCGEVRHQKRVLGGRPW